VLDRLNEAREPGEDNKKELSKTDSMYTYWHLTPKNPCVSSSGFDVEIFSFPFRMDGVEHPKGELSYPLPFSSIDSLS
jgi:hypothetical protein